MGNKASSPSTYLKDLWIPDDKVTECLNCHKKFSLTKRKHHCRCCGSIFCSQCWGKRVKLPAEYGFPDEEPTCISCYELFQGTLRHLREQRCVVVTFSLRDKNDPALPPLAQANIQEKKYKVYYMKVGRWRPFDSHTNLQFSSRPDGSRNRDKNPNRPGPRPSNIETGESVRADGPSLSGAMGESGVYERSFKEGDRESEVGSMAGSLRAPSGTFDRPSSRASEVTKRKSLIENPTDVAFTIPLNSILHVVFDQHTEGNYVTFETAQQFIRVQCVNLVDSPATTLTVPSDTRSTVSGDRKSDGGASDAAGTNSPSRKVKKTAAVDIEETLKLYAETVEALRILHGRTRQGGAQPRTYDVGEVPSSRGSSIAPGDSTPIRRST